MTEPDRPMTRKWVPILAAIYVVWPLDIIPDFIPVIGWIDDVVAIVIGIRAFLANRR